MLNDAHAISHIQVSTWRTSYVDILPVTLLTTLDETSATTHWRKTITRSSNRNVVLVAVLRSATLGFLWAGPARDQSGTEIAEIYATYVMPSQQSSGIGRLLMETADRMLLSRGFKSAVLWVFARNDLAQGFYEHLGWTADGHTLYWRKGRVNRAVVRFSKELRDT